MFCFKRPRTCSPFSDHRTLTSLSCPRVAFPTILKCIHPWYMCLLGQFHDCRRQPCSFLQEYHRIFSITEASLYTYCIVLEAILLLYSKPRGYRSRHFTLIHELSFTVGIRTRFLSTITLNTKSYIVLLDTGLKSPECCVEL